MLLSKILLLGAAALPALAQVPPNYTGIYETSVTDQSPDFNLVIVSKNKTLDGGLLGACHDGAAYEGMCISTGASLNGSDEYYRYQFNTTRYICTQYNSTGSFIVPCSTTPPDPYSQSGTITWNLPFNCVNNTCETVSQGMFFIFNTGSNVAMTQISFVNYSGQQVAFDKNGLMNIQEYADDTLEPGSEYLPGGPKPLYRWYICQTNYSGYHYTTLTWVLGKHSPQNPTCQKVDVKRVFL